MSLVVKWLGDRRHDMVSNHLGDQCLADCKMEGAIATKGTMAMRIYEDGWLSL